MSTLKIYISVTKKISTEHLKTKQQKACDKIIRKCYTQISVFPEFMFVSLLFGGHCGL